VPLAIEDLATGRRENLDRLLFAYELDESELPESAQQTALWSGISIISLLPFFDFCAWLGVASTSSGKRLALHTVFAFIYLIPVEAFSVDESFNRGVLAFIWLACAVHVQLERVACDKFALQEKRASVQARDQAWRAPVKTPKVSGPRSRAKEKSSVPSALISVFAKLEKGLFSEKKKRGKPRKARAKTGEGSRLLQNATRAELRDWDARLEKRTAGGREESREVEEEQRESR
jgi:hypothetical protein